MIKDKKVLGLIPARGGSKGVSRKNIRVTAGKPLIVWTAEEARKSKYLDRLVLSTEDSEIIAVAQQFGIEVPFRRPSELALDETPGIEPVLHALRELPGYDYVVLLQPTSPLRSVEDIDGCIARCEELQVNACVSIVKCRQHPYLMYSTDCNSVLHPVVPDANKFHRRQDYPIFYLLNGAVYVARTEWLEKSRSFLSSQTVGFEMPGERSLDIDSLEDFQRFEMRLGAPPEITRN